MQKATSKGKQLSILPPIKQLPPFATKLSEGIVQLATLPAICEISTET